MKENNNVCVIIGASHAGVNFAFALRQQGWLGEIRLIDGDFHLPYHRPPLSKAYLTSKDGIDKNLLKSEESYQKGNITLQLGLSVLSINRIDKTLTLSDATQQSYDKLVIATGARAFIPELSGLENASNLFSLRTAADVTAIRDAVNNCLNKRVVVLGGGYIGLETAASLHKMGAKVTILEREERVLSRVTAPQMSDFFQELHAKNNVSILTNKNVTHIEAKGSENFVFCSDGSSFIADCIVVGVGIRVNIELAQDAGLEIDNGIKVDAYNCTSDPSIYAIGDCTFHYNPHYDRFIRLESVQNAVDQAKIAAASIVGQNNRYDTIPWFWSDQYDIKLQIVGLSTGYNNVVIRTEIGEIIKFSVWYFKDNELLAVDAVNNAKAYVYGTKAIKERKLIDKLKLSDLNTEFKLENLFL
ncbi:NAD(P)/FAD-dependent oxidoreductase [Flavobacterium saccharophilum]|uniref:3-phenylpropionate/trans-cinnamate dioxygenase ferredoxin reductase subunit n=1 Tax=Flavobacterium saccharophilum TaxID=29534 RepID=A0A1M7JHV9_9FLAO|nr:FAD-dependent oxidoreductase [Flavobacterium saccharophilum]SHM52622.1 3-phenylpropionate/trans-cinnamate dioxygenase ferredoxin reductase subunit [Flavobacterium saccharophilum]